MSPHLPSNITKRGLSLEEAAEYVGVSANSLQRHGPKPTRIGGRCIYDRRALDIWLDNLAGIATIDQTEDADLLEAIHARKNKVRHQAR